MSINQIVRVILNNGAIQDSYTGNIIGVPDSAIDHYRGPAYYYLFEASDWKGGK